MSKPKAILFDLDGTLRDTVGIIMRAYEHAVETHNGRKPTQEELAPFIHHHSAVHKGLSSHVDYEEWLTTYRNKLGEDWMNAPLYHHCHEVLAALQTDGYRMAIVTSADSERTKPYMVHQKLRQYFDVVAAMHTGVRPKPAPDLLLEALAGLECRADEAIMIGDMVVDVQAAHEAGLPCVAVTHGFTSRDELQAAGADYVVDSLPELLEYIRATYGEKG